MNYLRTMSLVFLVILTGTTVEAQYLCGGPVTAYRTLGCTNGGCVGQYAYEIRTVGSSYTYGPATVKCCNKDVVTQWAEPGCQAASLKSPAAQQQLIELAKVSDIAVLNCVGEYVPFHSPTERLLNEAAAQLNGSLLYMGDKRK